MRDLVNLFSAYARTGMKTGFQYRWDSAITTLGVFFREAVCIIGMYFTLLKFDTLNGWRMKEMIFMFSIISMTYALLITFFMVFRDFPDWIKHGDFDRLLLRPRGLFLQMLLNGADWIAALSHGMLGLVLFVISANNVGIKWTVGNILYYIVTIISGTVIQGAVFVFFSSFCFYFGDMNSLREFIFWKSRKFASFPLGIYNNVTQLILMFVIPFAFVNYFPAQYLLRKEDMQAYPECLMYISPVVAVICFTVAYLFWRFSLRFYQ